MLLKLVLSFFRFAVPAGFTLLGYFLISAVFLGSAMSSATGGGMAWSESFPILIIFGVLLPLYAFVVPNLLAIYVRRTGRIATPALLVFMVAYAVSLFVMYDQAFRIIAPDRKSFTSTMLEEKRYVEEAEAINNFETANAQQIVDVNEGYPSNKISITLGAYRASVDGERGTLDFTISFPPLVKDGIYTLALYSYPNNSRDPEPKPMGLMKIDQGAGSWVLDADEGWGQFPEFIERTSDGAYHFRVNAAFKYIGGMGVTIRPYSTLLSIRGSLKPDDFAIGRKDIEFPSPLFSAP